MPLGITDDRWSGMPSGPSRASPSTPVRPMESTTLAGLLTIWGYPGLFLLLLLTGVGSPVPEDLLLLTAGYLVSASILSLPPALVVCVVGVVASDLLLYTAGRRFAWRDEEGWQPLVAMQARLRRATRWFDRLGAPLILLARLVPGTRALVFVTAGVRGVPAGAFLLYDTLGAVLWVPLLLAVGWRVGDELGGPEALVVRLRGSGLWLGVGVLVLLVLWRVWGREESKL
ncbi:MAG: DedA family protein [Vicinamibacterales bacterium]